MDIATAADRITKTLKTLEIAVGETVFDEWALVDADQTGWKLLEYGGIREAEFMKTFTSDITALRNTLDPTNIHVGDFAFSHEGYGSGFDAHICAGENILLLLNNTQKSTGEITANPKWKAAQIYFTELLEVFIADPVS